MKFFPAGIIAVVKSSLIHISKKFAKVFHPGSGCFYSVK